MVSTCIFVQHFIVDICLEKILSDDIIRDLGYVIMSSQEMTEAEGDNEELDPRVQEELEKLNNCTDEINRSVS